MCELSQPLQTKQAIHNPPPPSIPPSLPRRHQSLSVNYSGASRSEPQWRFNTLPSAALRVFSLIAELTARIQTRHSLTRRAAAAADSQRTDVFIRAFSPGSPTNELVTN